MTPEQHLNGQSKPTIEQVAWVFAHINDHMADPGTYRYLIYSRMGFGPNAYAPLLYAGGMNISNACVDLEEYEAARKVLQQSKPSGTDAADSAVEDA